MILPEMLILDIDRTVLTDEYRLLPEVVTAVSKARYAGMDVVLATARSPRAAAPIAQALGVGGPIICFNGAWTGTLIRGNAPAALALFSMNSRSSIHFIGVAEAAGLNPCWFTETGWFALSNGPLVAREERATGLKITLLGEPGDTHGAILKMQCLERVGVSAAQTLALYAGQFAITYSDMHLIEITAPHVSKKAAAIALAAERDLKPAGICAIGDSENDLSLIEWAGVGIAMGNATHAVKAVANKITKTNQEAGVAHAIAWLLETRATKMQESFA